MILWCQVTVQSCHSCFKCFGSELTFALRAMQPTYEHGVLSTNSSTNFSKRSDDDLVWMLLLGPSWWWLPVNTFSIHLCHANVNHLGPLLRSQYVHQLRYVHHTAIHSSQPWCIVQYRDAVCSRQACITGLCVTRCVYCFVADDSSPIG